MTSNLPTDQRGPDAPDPLSYALGDHCPECKATGLNLHLQTTDWGEQDHYVCVCRRVVEPSVIRSAFAQLRDPGMLGSQCQSETLPIGAQENSNTNKTENNG